MTGKIFINYRRGDDAGNTGRLFDRLQDAFDPEQLFLDVDNIAPGQDFVRVLGERVAECDIVLTVIGKGWLEMRNASGLRRLDDPEDFVRIEIASALEQGKTVIPVLVGEAQMPLPNELPADLRPLSRRNAVRLTHERFRSDTQGLVKALQHMLSQIEAQRIGEKEAARLAAIQAERRRQEAEIARLAAAEAERQRAAKVAEQRAAEERRQAQAAAEARIKEERAFTEAIRTNTVAALDAVLAVYPNSSIADEARKHKATLIARAEEEQRRRAEQERARERAKEERTFADAIRANTVAALDAAIVAYPASNLVEKAQQLRGLLVAREEVYRQALASNAATVLKSFLAVYHNGADVNQVRKRLRGIELGQRATSRPVLIGLGALAAAIITIAIFAIPSKTPRLALQEAPIPEIKQIEPPSEAEISWALLKDTTDAAALNRFIERFPDHPLRKKAEARIASLTAAATAKAEADRKAQVIAQAEAAARLEEARKAQAAAEAEAAARVAAANKELEAQRAALEANQKREQFALAKPADTQPVAAVPAVRDPTDIVRLIKIHLQDVGCNPGDLGGGWTKSAREALAEFNKNAGTRLDVSVASLDTLQALTERSGRVCPLVCPKGQKVENDKCAPIACDPGSALGADDICHKKAAQKTTSSPKRHAPTASASSGAKCFTFNGKRFCE